VFFQSRRRLAALCIALYVVQVFAAIRARPFFSRGKLLEAL
jgi:hypothetical protein